MYARLRDAPDGGNCISCGEWKPFEGLDGGHFIPTTVPGIRFDEKNIHAQCHKCNRFLHGNQAAYLVGLEHKLGREVVDELMDPRHRNYIWTAPELEEVITTYKDKLKSL